MQSKKRLFEFCFLSLLLVLFTSLVFAAITINSPSGDTNYSRFMVLNVSTNPSSNATFIFSNSTSSKYNFTVDNVSSDTLFQNVSFNTSSLPDGVYNLVVNVTNSSGNLSTSSSISNVVIDNTAPNITLSQENRTSSSLNVTINTSSDASSCVSNLGNVTGSGALQSVLALSLTANTAYSFNINCSDEVGNNGTITSSFTTLESSSSNTTSSSSTTTTTEFSGCTDSSACNYDSSATSNDDSCTYAELYYDCNGNCLSDSDGDGICDQLDEEEEVSKDNLINGASLNETLEDITGGVVLNSSESKWVSMVKPFYVWIVSIALMSPVVYLIWRKKKK